MPDTDTQTKTPDLGAAAFASLYTPLRRIEKPENGRLALFVFDAGAGPHLSAFYEGAAVSAQKMAEAIHRMKKALHDPKFTTQSEILTNAHRTIR